MSEKYATYDSVNEHEVAFSKPASQTSELYR